MSTTPLLAGAADNGLAAGASSEKYLTPGARERLRAHASGKRFGANEALNHPAPDDTAGKKTWALTHEGRRARELAAAASALAEELRGSEFDVFVGPAKSVAASAAAYAESLLDAKIANNLEFSLAEFNALFANARPKIAKFDDIRRKSSTVLRQYRCRPRAGDRKHDADDPKHDAGGGRPNPSTEPKDHPCDGEPNPHNESKHDVAQARAEVQDPQAFNVADVAALVAVQLRRESPDSALASTSEAFAHEARKFAQNSSDRNARALFVLTRSALRAAAKDSPPQFAAAVHVLLSAAEALDTDSARDSPPSNRSSRPERQVPTSDAVIGKHQVLYAMALAAPIALLTSAAGLHLFPENWAWVAGVGVAVWILAMGGMLLNQFGQMDWERIAAAHLSRLGVLGAVVLMSFYAYLAYFPHFLTALIILVGFSLVSVGLPWIFSCFRPDEANAAAAPETVAADGMV